LAPLPDEPPTPELDPDERIPGAIRAELKGLPPETADVVAAHLLAAGRLAEEDPALAYRHAEAARRRAARLPVVREATAEAAYAAGLYEEALAQYRVLRRMTGSSDCLPVMADCLRALGKPRDALSLLDEGRHEVRDAAMRVEAVIVQAGARADLEQWDEADRLLRQLIERPPAGAPKPAVARAWHAWAQRQVEAGRPEEARRGFQRAVRLDPSGLTDALDRLDDLDGFHLVVDEEALAGEDDDSATPASPSDSDDEQPRGPASPAAGVEEGEPWAEPIADPTSTADDTVRRTLDGGAEPANDGPSDHFRDARPGTSDPPPVPATQPDWPARPDDDTPTADDAQPTDLPPDHHD